MAGSLSNNDDEMISGINVTPLVDVVLVLLIIFLITAPVIYQSAIKVQLPQVKSGDSAASPKTPLQFTLNKEGELYWNSEKFTWEQLDEKLKTMGDSVKQETAFVSADEATPHGVVVRLMDVLRQAGLGKFSLNVEVRK